MPTYKTTFNGKTVRVTADTPEQAATAARLYLAGRGQADDVAARANERSRAAVRDQGLDDPMSPQFQALRERGQMQGTADAAGPSMAILGAGAGAGLAPAGFIPAMLKDTAIYGGAELAEKALGLPSWTGEALGAISPIKSLGKLLLGGAMGGAKRGATAAVSEGAEAAAARLEREFLMKEAESAAKIARADRIADARIEAIKARGTAKAPSVPKATAKPSPPAAPPTEGATALADDGAEFIDQSAVKVLPFPPAKGTVKPGTNLGGKAKPGPPGTPPEKLEETLQATLDSLKAKKAGTVRGKSPVVDNALDTAEGMHQREATAGMTELVSARRKAVGSQKVARELGMERHQVQSDAGTVLNEALGEVSPIIPEEPWTKIALKMKDMTDTERQAYIGLARSEKVRAQMETLRRSLKAYGWSLPAAMAIGSVDQ